MNIELVKKAQKAFEWYDKAVDNSVDYLNLEREEQQYAWNALDKLFEAIARQSIKSEEVAISKTETTTEPCEWCSGIQDHGIASVRTVFDEFGRELPAYDE